jgi:hypothetical protein
MKLAAKTIVLRCQIGLSLGRFCLKDAHIIGDLVKLDLGAISGLLEWTPKLAVVVFGPSLLLGYLLGMTLVLLVGLLGVNSVDPGNVTKISLCEVLSIYTRW